MTAPSPTEHDLKSWPEYFTPIIDGTKNFELRKNDRDYKVGDTIRLREWKPDPLSEGYGEYTGRECWREITYVLDGVGHQGVIAPLKGLLQGYCILGLR